MQAVRVELHASLMIPTKFKYRRLNHSAKPAECNLVALLWFIWQKASGGMTMMESLNEISRTKIILQAVRFELHASIDTGPNDRRLNHSAKPADTMGGLYENSYRKRLVRV